jgi:hypothetical protein
MMKPLLRSSGLSVKVLALVAGSLAVAGIAKAQEKFVAIQGAQCATPPPMHCPASECDGAMVIHQGLVTEIKTRRPYFLDYPCDLKPGEPVTFILNLHGGGSYGNWQRHYFPAMDYKEKYRLVVATPNSPVRAWSDVDDAYLQNIVEFVVGQIGKQNIKAFWLVGHSQGGATSNRLIRTDFFKSRVDGFLSLSGGRIGGNPGRADFNKTIRPEGIPERVRAPGATAGAPAAGGATRAAGATPGAPAGAAARPAATLPDGDFSHIYASGRREMDEKGLPESSEWAAKYGCGPRRAAREVVDVTPGYVYDSSQIGDLRPAWGLLPAGGKANLYTFPNCKDGRVVADVERLDKGHTEGHEPKITEELIKLMLSAKGGKIQQGNF